MGKYIGFGNWNRNYLFILADVLVVIINDSIKGLGYYTYKLELIKNNDYGGHTFIHKLFYYLLVLIFSLLYYIYQLNKDKNNKPINNSNNHNLLINNEIELIHTGPYNYDNSNISNYFVYFVIFLYILSEFVEIIACQLFPYADFWMFELIIMAFLTRKIFKIKIYEHQKVSLWSISIPIILKLTTIILLFSDRNNHLDETQINYKYNDTTDQLKLLYVAHAWLFPIASILHFSKMTMNSYSMINFKKFMDLKYISIEKLFIMYGILGIFFSLLISIIATFYPCGKRNNELYDIYDYICFITDDDGVRFMENLRIYFNGNIWKDVLITFFSSVALGLELLFLFKIVENLTPVHKSISHPIIFFIEKTILLYQINNDEPIKYINENYFIDLSSDIMAIIELSIYLEIIELNFCNLNNNLRKYIIIRSNSDAENNNIKIERNDSISNNDIEILEIEDFGNNKDEEIIL